MILILPQERFTPAANFAAAAIPFMAGRIISVQTVGLD
jgi:hypothetical protein